MDNFCNSEFWNDSVTWNTNDPNFTKCFEETVLTWIPCGIIVFFGLIETIQIINDPRKWMGMTILGVLKGIGTLALIGLHVAYFILLLDLKNDYDVSDSELFLPIAKILSYICAVLLLVLTLAKGVHSSGTLFIFWLISAVCAVFPFQRLLRADINQDDEKESLEYLVTIINFGCVIVLLFLNCWADNPSKKKRKAYDEDNPCPEESASFLSKLLFFWFESLAWLGFRKPLETNDLWKLNEKDRSKAQVPIFLKHWNAAVEAKKRKYGTQSGNKVKVSLLGSILKTYSSQFLLAIILKLVQDSLAFVSPNILSLLIDFIEGNKEYPWQGYFYAGLMFVTAILQTLFLARYFHVMFLVGMRLRTALTSIVYQKALSISNTARKESTTGEIVNLMSVDIQRLVEICPYVNMLWSSPYQIILSVLFLWNILGPSALSGLAVMTLMIPLQGYVASKMKVLQVDQMNSKDKRVKLMTEILAGIKVLKLYAWEPSFKELTVGIRQKEIKALKKNVYVTAVTAFIWVSTPFLVSLVTFATYVLVDENNVLTPQKAFVALSLFNIMKMPMTFLPMMVIFLIQGKVSLERLNKFLCLDDIDESAVSHEENAEYPISMEDCSFTWDKAPSIENVTLKVKQGSLVAVVGSVGSGKSTLLASMLGELDKISGRANVKGSIAYVSQQAWIQNNTLRDNITFGLEFDKLKYNSIIRNCALGPDLSILPAGDKTEIGEKGVNLSGGQKQRVSLARATYCDSDIYLLDDPLSAVDSHVGKHIFENVIGPGGQLQNKTRVLVTHSISFLPKVDQIVVMRDGQISEMGTYQELIKSKGAFSEFLEEHLADADDNEYNDVIAELQNVLGEKKTKSIIRRRQSTLSSESVASSDSKKRGKSMELLSPVDKLIEAEKAETGRVKSHVYLYYIKTAGLGFTIVGFSIFAIQQVFTTGLSIWLSIWSEEGEEADNLRYLGVYGAFGVGQAITVMLGRAVMGIGMIQAGYRMHNDMLTRILRSPMSFFDTTPLGRIVNRFSKDIDVVDNLLPQNLREWITCLFQVLATLIIISYSTPWFTVVILPLGVVYYVIQRFYVSSSRQLKRLESVSRSPIYSHFSETLTGCVTIRAYGAKQRFIHESEMKVDANQECYFPSIVANRWLAVRLETIGSLIILSSALTAVIAKDTISAGDVGLSVSYALQITQTLNWLVRMTSDVETNIVAVERIKEYCEVEQEADWEIVSRKPKPSWPERGMIRFENYKTKYRKDLDLVLKGISCLIEPGDKIGVVGRTGAGKSSLTLALFRIIEAVDGNIHIDDENISKIGLHDLRKQITIIPQDPVLFSGTLRMNLDPFEAYDDQAIWRALELAHLKPFVSNLTDGLSYEIHEGGENLSVGQRQLVCLARALLKKTKILILDEATAAVDLDTDALIQTTIRQQFQECTVITIAHRLNTIMDSTRVMVLDKGEIKEFDLPKILLRDKNSIFHGMAKDAGLV